MNQGVRDSRQRQCPLVRAGDRVDEAFRVGGEAFSPVRISEGQAISENTQKFRLVRVVGHRLDDALRIGAEPRGPLRVTATSPIQKEQAGQSRDAALGRAR